jgi:hypothetical protein
MQSDENLNGAVIGAGIAGDVFGEDIPLGRAFTFHDQEFIVRGVFAPFKNATLSLDTDFNNAIFVPDAVADQLTNNNAAIYEILAQSGKGKDPDVVAAGIEKTLISGRGNQQDFTVLKQEESLNVTSNILNMFTRLIGAIAAISLVVGGIGIMNVMLVSVTERMNEIGIRKAIGATSRQIMSQFLIEATVLSVVGGIIGVLLSILVNFLLRIATNIEPIVSWQVVVLAALVSLIVGIVFRHRTGAQGGPQGPDRGAAQRIVGSAVLDTVLDVGHLVGRPYFKWLESYARSIYKKSLAAADCYWRNMQPELINKAGCKVLVDDIRATGYCHVLCPGGFLRLP